MRCMRSHAGFLVLPGFASPEEVGALRQRVAELIKDFDPEKHRSIFSTRNQVSGRSHQPGFGWGSSTRCGAGSSIRCGPDIINQVFTIQVWGVCQIPYLPPSPHSPVLKLLTLLLPPSIDPHSASPHPFLTPLSSYS